MKTLRLIVELDHDGPVDAAYVRQSVAYAIDHYRDAEGLSRDEDEGAVETVRVIEPETDSVLSAFRIHVLAEEIRARSCAVVVFSPEDVFERFDGPSADAIRWMGAHADRLEDLMSEHGNLSLDDLLHADGKYRDADEDDSEDDQ